MSAEAKLVAINVLKIFNVLGLVLLIGLTFLVLNRIAHQSVVNHDDTRAATARIEGDLSCLGRFFSQTNRTNLKIDDLNTCTIINTKSGQTEVLSATNAPTQAPSSASINPARSQASQTVVPSTPTSPASKPTTTSAPPNPQPTAPSVFQQAYDTITQPIKGLVSNL